MDDGLFEVTLITKPKNPLELQEILTALVLQEDNTDMIYSFKTRKIILESEEKVAWTLDGEFGGEHECVTIANNQKAVEIIVGD
jgi:diacylglycerol kinase family enzyme